MPTKPKKTKDGVKRLYRIDLIEKLKDGQPWKLAIEIDNDVALEIAKEFKDSPVGGKYKTIINTRLRESYKRKKKK